MVIYMKDPYDYIQVFSISNIPTLGVLPLLDLLQAEE